MPLEPIQDDVTTAADVLRRARLVHARRMVDNARRNLPAITAAIDAPARRAESAQVELPVYLRGWDPLRLSVSLSALPRYPTAREIIAWVSSLTDFSVPSLRGDRRNRGLVEVRQIAMWICAGYLCGASYTLLGKAFGGRDHTTVLYGVRKIQSNVFEGTELGVMAEMLRARVHDKAIQEGVEMTWSSRKGDAS